LRVPGIGLKSAARIISARLFKLPAWEELKKLGVVMKRAKYFLTINGRRGGEPAISEKNFRAGLLEKTAPAEQLELFGAAPRAALL